MSFADYLFVVLFRASCLELKAINQDLGLSLRGLEQESFRDRGHLAKWHHHAFVHVTCLPDEGIYPS
jgi:hypothetical protein